MSDEIYKQGVEKSKTVAIDQVMAVLGIGADFDFHGQRPVKKHELMCEWVNRICGMNELSDIDRVAYGTFLYAELRNLYQAKEHDKKLMAVEKALPDIKTLTRNAGRASKDGDTDRALSNYMAAFKKLPVFPALGLKAASLARSKYQLATAQQLAEKVSWISDVPKRWRYTAQKLAIECMIRRMTPWLDYGLAPKVVFMLGGEGGYVNLFELVKNPYLAPRKHLSAKTQQVFDRLGKDLHLLFTMNTSTIFGEDDLDFPVCSMSSYVKGMTEGLDLVQGYLAPDPKHRRYYQSRYIGAEYRKMISEYIEKQGQPFEESSFRILNYEPVWDWATKYLEIYCDKPEPWMTEHNALLKAIEATYPQEKVLEKQQAYQEFQESL